MKHIIFFFMRVSNFTSDSLHTINMILNISAPKAHIYLTLAFHSSFVKKENLGNSLNISDKDLQKINEHKTIYKNKFKREVSDNIKSSVQTPSMNYVRKTKHFPPASKEWLDSVYTYNNNIIKTLPYLHKSLSNLVKGYFNLYSNRLKKNIKKHGSKRIEKMKIRRSINRILVSEAELTHTNSKVVVTLYIYNSEKNYFLNKIKKIPSIYESSKTYIDKTSKSGLNLKSKLQNHKSNLLHALINKNLKLNNKTFLSKLDDYQDNYIRNFVRKFLRKEIISVYFKQLLVFNKAKFESKYVLLLADQIKKVYNKNVEFNFVNLKHLYLNNYIFSIAVLSKIERLARIKKSFMLAIKKSLNMFKIPSFKSRDIYNEIYNKEMIVQNSGISDDIVKSLHNNILANTESKRSDTLDKLSILTKFSAKMNPISGELDENKNNSYSIDKVSKLGQIFKSTKHKFLNGVRLEIAGRLTKRSSAARSIFKVRNKGNIRNKDSSDKGLSTVMLRGYSRSNLQYNKVYSKVRGGSFGIKG